MAYFQQIEFVCLGAAVVIDTVLLLTLTERRNLRYVALPVVLLVLGAWLWHGGQFLHLLLAGWNGPLASGIHWTLMFAMSLGLLLMPSAMLHGLWRLLRNRMQPLRQVQTQHAVCYLPLVLLVPIGFALAHDPRSKYLTLVNAWIMPYAGWLAATNLATALGLFRMRRRWNDAISESFLRWLAVGLAALTVLQSTCLFLLLDTLPEHRPLVVLAVTLSPLLPALLFAYFLIRFNFTRLVLERSLLYAGLLVAALLVHRGLARSVGQVLAERYGVDATVLLAMLLIGGVLAHRPLRRRAAEGLRYLMGGRVDLVRHRTRQLALALSSQSNLPAAELLDWFLTAVCDALELDWTGGWLYDDHAAPRCCAATADRLTSDEARQLYEELRAHEVPVSTRRDAPSQPALDRMHQGRASLAIVIGHREIQGLLVFGLRGGRDLGEEETGALALLAEQLAITLASGQLQAERLAAERRALQNEKLSSLGLLASSIAHEVKNPLSSIKTIATVLAESLGDDSPHAEDLQLILGEIDRLSTTTHQLLQFARPSANGGTAGHVAPAVEGTLQVMRHLARQRGVQLTAELAPQLPPVKADQNALREIVFNLLSNAIDAAGNEGHVEVACQLDDDAVVLRVADNGPGLAPEVQDRLFEPFLTTKQTGTGLGLYVVNRRVRECGGTIACESGPQRGTCFSVRLPLASTSVSSDSSALHDSAQNSDC